MDLKVIHDTLRFYLDKFQMSWYSPEEQDNILDRAQMQVFDSLRPQYAMSQQMHDNLLAFKAEYNFTNGTSPGGLITLPDNYESLLAVQTQIIDGTVTIYPPAELLNEAQISDRRSSQLTAVSTKYPAGLLKAGKQFQLYPAQVSAGTVYYLRRPVAPEFVYETIGREIIYDIINSIQLEWDDTAVEKIIFKALGLLGINLADNETIQIADIKEKEIA